MTTGVKVGLGLAAAVGAYLAFRKGKDGLNSIQRLLGKDPSASIPRQALTVDEVRTVDSKFNSADGRKTLLTSETGSARKTKKGDTFNTPRQCPAGQHAVSNGDGTWTCVVNNA